MPTMFEEEPKARCPDCSQSLTFIRTKSHQKRWYCYACEKYIDRPSEPTLIKDAHARIEALNGLQVIDSHGMIVGRVRKAISNDTGDVRSLVLSVDKEQFKTLLDERDLPREFEIGHEKIATAGGDLEHRQMLEMQCSAYRRRKTLHQVWGIVDLCFLRIMRNTEPN